MSASSILSRLRHKGQITEEEYRKLMDIKNRERHTQRVIEDIRAEIERATIEMDYDTAKEALDIIDKHTQCNESAIT